MSQVPLGDDVESGRVVKDVVIEGEITAVMIPLTEFPSI